MCGRYGLFASPQTTADQFDLAQLSGMEPRYNIAPTQNAAVVRPLPEGQGRRLDRFRWGLIPFWAEDPGDLDYDLINARAETLPESGAFRKQFYEQRCLVPASGFYEWKNTGHDKQPYWIHPTGNDLFGFAGLWDRWEDSRSDRVIESFAIITCEPNETVELLHDRMPVILDPSEYSDWLNGAISDRDRLQSLLDPYPDPDMDLHPVSTAVNDPTFDRPECVEPVGNGR